MGSGNSCLAEFRFASKIMDLVVDSKEGNIDEFVRRDFEEESYRR